MNTLHERRIEINEVDALGIHFMCWDQVEYNSVHTIFSAKEARWLAQELLAAADELDELDKPEVVAYNSCTKGAAHK